MIRPGDIAIAHDLEQRLRQFDAATPLVGLNNPLRMQCFINQLVDSIRRVGYVVKLTTMGISVQCTDPNNIAFDPLKGALYHFRNGDNDEAFWLVFLATHFGRHKITKWGLVKGVYGQLGSGHLWDWNAVIADPQGMGHWIEINSVGLKACGNFSNHRKYESLQYNLTGAAINSYVDWTKGNHTAMFNGITQGLLSPYDRFKALFNAMGGVYRFGRTGRFDYLTMVGKLGLQDIQPDSTYMSGATGPYTGACLLFTGNPNSLTSRTTLNNHLNALDLAFGQFFGMQILEDALCNWQKSPEHYEYFNG